MLEASSSVVLCSCHMTSVLEGKLSCFFCCCFLGVFWVFGFFLSKDYLPEKMDRMIPIDCVVSVSSWLECCVEDHMQQIM